MKLREIFSSGKTVFSIEFFPTKTAEGEKRFWRNFPVFKSLKPDFCSVTYATTGQSHNQSMEVLERIRQQEGLQVMCHLTCLGRTREQMRKVLDELVASGIDNLIALRGDRPKVDGGWIPEPGGFKYAADLVREAASYKHFSIAVAGFPENHPEAESPEKDLEALKRKVDAGADVIFTQLFFDNVDFLRFRDRVKAAGISVPVVPGIMAIRSVNHMKRVVELCKSKIPSRMAEDLAKFDKDDGGAVEYGIDYAIRQCRGLMTSGVPGLHFFSFNEPHPLVTIVHAIGLAGR